MRKYAIAASAIVLIGLGVAWGPISRHYSASAAYSCTAQGDTKCPDSAFIADWHKIEAYNDKYRAPQAEADTIQATFTRLQTQVPDGYKFDSDKSSPNYLHFVKMTPQEMDTLKAQQVKDLHDKLTKLGAQ